MLLSHVARWWNGESPNDQPTPSPLAGLFRDLPEHPKILLIGYDAAGKSTILRKHLAPKSEITNITVLPGYSIEAVRHEDATILTYDIGLCSPDAFRLIDRAVFHMADAVVYVVDANNVITYLDARSELMMEGLNESSGIRNGVPLLILGNKQDLRNARKPEQMKIFFIDNISTSIGDRPTHVLGSNAKSGEGIREAFAWVNETLAMQKSEKQHDLESRDTFPSSIPTRSKETSVEEEIRAALEPTLQNISKRHGQ